MVGVWLGRDVRAILIIYKKIFATFFVPFSGILRLVIRANIGVVTRAAAAAHQGTHTHKSTAYTTTG